ncbi:periplasmic phosphate binding protein [Denitrovibrio acetiphilus DSM 12809]|uniref:Periplasmic phosphate binding protein n=1 Tax=Denitrovibrio acetiphilus (strain DSM 12809 / NBRC 114555 / N2460) TaxID=522772 RepID=D4H8P5_DENA2|nr:PstS family phosphate ABC transporter substrate-binding protein [Denitrovibrio acetiphilus]ADD68394.1 periplasmic phosphate binding protein [Denitrovibrio acetiphilus DSM 12809]
MKKFLTLALVAAFMTMSTVAAHARDQIRIVGSSTVYPFASYVAEEFGATTGNPTPIIESTGSGGGHKLFSAGVDMNTPDITNSSRRMKTSEFDKNMAAGVKNITEIVIGYDGIAIAFNKTNPDINFTRKDLTLAVAAEVPVNGKLVANPYKKWNEINPALPAKPILVYGPPTSSGTRDAFEELVMEKVTKKMAEYGNKGYGKIRQDGIYVPAGENDNLIVQKLSKDKDAFGIFGYSFLEENADRIKGASVDGVDPVPANISSGKYPVSRSLFFYVKLAHLDKVPGLEKFVDMFLSEQMIGTNGLLKTIGLIPLPDADRDAVRARWSKRQNLTKADLAH